MVGMPARLSQVSRATFITIALLLLVSPERTGIYAQGSSVTMRIAPASQVVALDETFSVWVVAELSDETDPYGLAGYEFVLVYDTGYLDLLDVVDAGQLSGPNNRTVGTLGPRIVDAAGRVLFGGYSYDEAAPRIAGPTGTVTLANVTFRATATGGTTLSLDNAVVIDTQARAWPDPAAGRQIEVQSASISVEEEVTNDTPTVTATVSPSLTFTLTAPATSTPTTTPTPTPTPSPSSTAAATSSPTVTATPPATTSVTPTSIPTQTNTPTPTATTSIPTPTSTPTPTATATQTVTAGPTPTASVTPTATQGTSPSEPQHWVFVPLIGRDWQYDLEVVAGSVQFTCSDWCQAGSTPGTQRQIVTTDEPVENWRAYLNGLGPTGGVFTERSPTRAVLDVPAGLHVRVEALYQGEWLLACESRVECPSQ